VKKTLLILMILGLCAPIGAFAANGQPFVALQKQVDEVRFRTEAMQEQLDQLNYNFHHPVLRESPEVLVTNENNGLLHADCADDEIVIAGGYKIYFGEVFDQFESLYKNKPCDNKRCWEVQLLLFEGPWEALLTAYALCVKVDLAGD
jgi:hypothetical protein